MLLTLPALTLEEFELRKILSEATRKRIFLNVSIPKEDRFTQLIDALDLSNMNKEERRYFLSTIGKYPHQFCLKGDKS